MRAVIETGARVHNVTRYGIDKVASKGRGDHPFALTIHEADGSSRIDLARAVIDASGTWSNPNPASASGTPAIGEVMFVDRIAYGVPDVLGRDRATYAHQRVLVIGGGHSAANVLLDLAKLAEMDLRTNVIWAVRAADLSRVFGGGSADKLPARGKLGEDLRHLVEHGRLTLALGFSVERIDRQGNGLVVSERAAQNARMLGPVDRIIVCTGQRPDLVMTRELRLDLDPWLESSRALGPMIDPNLHSCGTVPPHGHKELSHPEPGYYAVGIKSYGRAPTFLMATGYEQVRSVAASLAGDAKGRRTRFASFCRKPVFARSAYLGLELEEEQRMLRWSGAGECGCMLRRRREREGERRSRLRLLGAGGRAESRRECFCLLRYRRPGVGRP